MSKAGSGRAGSHSRFIVAGCDRGGTAQVMEIGSYMQVVQHGGSLVGGRRLAQRGSLSIAPEGVLVDSEI